MTARKGTTTAIAPALEAGAVSPVDDLLRLAVSNNTSVDAIEKLVVLHERVYKAQAEREFNSALCEFQSACPPIRKSRTATIRTRGGSSFAYKYAELDAIAEVVNPLLGRCGLSYTWDSTTENNTLNVRCILRHANGHQIQATFAAPVDGEARMSATQAHAAALTYAKRQSLTQVLGLTTCDTDTDANVPEGPTVQRVTALEAQNLEALCDEAGAERERFLAWLRVGRFEDVPASQYDAAIKALERKKAQAAASETPVELCGGVAPELVPEGEVDND